MSRQVSSSVHSKSQPVSLAKRLLFPGASAGSDLPPLFATSTTPPELTAELYDFIALALRAFVNPWWTKISRYDKDFLPEITRILTHVVRIIEHRVLDTDLAPLVFRDIPVLVTQHYQDYRNASAKLSSSYASGGALSVAQLFHQLQPHTALSADGTIDSEYFRQVVDVILKACLPEEDYAPESERVIVREVILKIVLNDIIPKITQPWFINKIILDLLDPPPVILKSPASPQVATSSHFSYHTFLVMLLSAIQSISGVCLALINAYKQAVNTIKLVNQSSTTKYPSRQPEFEPSPLPGSIPIPPPSRAPLEDPLATSSPTSSRRSSSSQPRQSTPSPDTPHIGNQDYACPPLLMVSEIFAVQDRFASNTIVNTVLMLSSCFVVFLDRLLPYMLKNMLSPAFLLKTIRTGKRTLFPNGYPAPPPIDPTPQEQAEMRASLLGWTGNGATAHFLPLFLGPKPSTTIEAALDPLSDRSCNVHLVMMILDRVIVALFPELLGRRID